VFWKESELEDMDSTAFVPARLQDNPFLDREDYARKLMHLPPVERARLLAGDWSVVEDALIHASWLRYYGSRGDQLRALDVDGGPLQHGSVDARQCRRFITIDTAGTSEQKAKEARGKAPSWTVAATWDYWPERKYLFLRDIWRARVGFNGIVDGIRAVNEKWSPGELHIENAHLGPAVYDVLRGSMPIKVINPVTSFMKGQSGKPGKVTRATPLFNKLALGQVLLPAGNNSWLHPLEAEWLSWSGMDDEQADQIDVASYASTLVYDWRAPKPIESASSGYVAAPSRGTMR
jgi:phage terminase large subunit-like protein